ncbi:hypothetical protein HT102_01605 [Hoyosella sp. G463]|uniref:Uncharacterized protein n=1 Tax=Lolliginicoccus lacisalsi TaxID=2742202 RepID=A0A927J9W6_9ACTN|nr:hypothetical protein [Lolliginicoccus lacisalsi]MBD8505186.1 hypothetical protein [Lolliginicoccus lacisalsi]
MFAILALVAIAVMTATVLAFAATGPKTYWRVSAVVLWAGIGVFIARATVLEDLDGLPFLLPIAMLLLIAGSIATYTRVIVSTLDTLERRSGPMGRRRW